MSINFLRSLSVLRNVSRTYVNTGNTVVHRKRLLGFTPPTAKENISHALGIITVTTAGVYIGGHISSFAAEFLEEYNIFVPEDDDD